jgi:hypothetical protein
MSISWRDALSAPHLAAQVLERGLGIAQVVFDHAPPTRPSLSGYVIS